MPINIITSDSMLTDIEHHFRVSAGPGAGKTHWLVEHIKNVLHRSERLGITRKIACITYTNIAVETIQNRLGISADQVEVSTIHSFLYKHIVKPYASFIAMEYGLNIEDMDGHDDTILSNYSFLKEWKKKTNQPWIRRDNEIVSAISKAKWKFQERELIFRPNYPMKADGYPIRSDSYYEYKKMTWEKGILHHEDVLFFSYQLIRKYPLILKVLRAKFPYFFVDEFQDTNPIQAEILHQIGQNETVVGLIGDAAQSIYSFQGADPEKFMTFNLPAIYDYQIEWNRRSTNNIIQILNGIRLDIQQISPNDEIGDQPTIIVGEMNDSLRWSIDECGDEKVCSLSRANITSNAMKREINGSLFKDELFEELQDTDKSSSQNGYRSKVIIACIKATELARQSKFKDAIKELENVFKERTDKTRGKREALKHIQTLLKKYDNYKNESLYGFFLIVKADIKNNISDLRSGRAKTFYERHTYLQLSLCVRIVEDTSQHKTIHKAKGDEFENVLLILTEEDKLAFLLTPDLTGTNKEAEEQRINYVAISRAKKRLFISVPSLQANNKAMLSSKFRIKIL
ncbi:MAG: ATP-dependent helicase [Deltaproteobacteria bacterium HGW-Deltaproteobacteria-19]|nr:MAG: ATP-dependent helicase [Deltaproteobacteria bacterium HGW-Deltaproteobacteria-19]